ncbi:hypothetical protein JCM19241_3375 [Vibrio ishigakensis]|uniref:Uncharacterized protein n=1 Tax=Vibrio ishigakensis TaxID=1481914 RepID=A0A0B8QK20_9VIBR|nr:hypothetical protein JCM19241_3375 [Vibrio ishigakensis]
MLDSREVVKEEYVLKGLQASYIDACNTKENFGATISLSL